MKTQQVQICDEVNAHFALHPHLNNNEVYLRQCREITQFIKREHSCEDLDYEADYIAKINN